MKGAVLFIVAAATVAVVPAAQPSAGGVPTNVVCGQRLTRSTTLANDLRDCPRNGLAVAASGITVDLNGHTIDGTNARIPGTGGVVVLRGRRNVTIVNGTITEFYFAGVGLAARTTVRKLTITDIGVRCRQGDLCAGIFAMGAPGSTIADSAISVPANGINVFRSRATRVERNRIERNRGDGVSMFESPNSRVVANTFSGNRGNGLHVNNSSDSVLVSGNRASGNAEAGIAVGASRRARVVGNMVSGNGQAGLLLFDLRNSLARGNQASGNGVGIVLYGGQAGVAQFGGKHGARGNRLLGNTATENRRAGIWVKGDSRRDSVGRNLISGNAANDNGRLGGIVVSGVARSNRLRANTANANAGHGITVVRGTIDGGGNRARGNRRRPQCVRIRCS
jgi:parallel beta-helix repeat protein